MTTESEFSLICDENQPDFEYTVNSVQKKKSPKQTTLHIFMKAKNDDVQRNEESPIYDDQTKLEYLDRGTTSPVPVAIAYKTPHSTKRTAHRKSKKWQQNYEETTPQKTSSRQVPAPLSGWTESAEVWKNMILKEEASNLDRNPRLFEKQVCYLPRMRAILLDWIMEVCEVYKLRRVTYYLAVDYIDRYLTIKPDVPKTQLQLVGVSCLFMAAKLEEIYPPRLSEFSYVCDGACTDSEILSCELLILNSLGWDMNPLTPSGWLNLYMQIHTDARNLALQGIHGDVNTEFFYPRYSGYKFIKASQIIDLFSLDPGFLRYSYSTIAAAAVYFVYDKNVALTVSGLTWEQLRDCVEYMAVFYKIIRDSDDPKLESVSCYAAAAADDQTPGAPNCGTLKAEIPTINTNENHSIQAHSVDLNYFEKATLLRLEQMGLKVEKTLVRRRRRKKKKKKKHRDMKREMEDEEMAKEEEEEEVQNNEACTEEEETTTVVMFEVEKVNMETVIAPPPSSPEVKVAEVMEEEEYFTQDSCSSLMNIFSLGTKTRVSFDDILASLDECSRKAAIRSSSSSSSEDESEQQVQG